MEIDNDALDVHVIIMEGERKDFEARISKLELREPTMSQQVGELKNQVEELVAPKGFIENKIKISNERQHDITPFHDQAYII